MNLHGLQAESSSTKWPSNVAGSDCRCNTCGKLTNANPDSQIRFRNAKSDESGLDKSTSCGPRGKGVFGTWTKEFCYSREL
jgi:hypothetical protein